MSFTIEPNDRFFQVNHLLNVHDIHPGNTVTFFSEVDLTQIEKIRASAKESGNPRPSYTVFVVKSLAMAMKEYPYVNRRVYTQPWRLFNRVRVQTFHKSDIAIAAERALPGREYAAFVDVLRDADKLSLTEIREWLSKLAKSDENNNEQWRSFFSLATKLPPWLSTLLIRLPCYLPKMWVQYRGAATLISSPAKYGVDGVVATWAWPLGVSFGFAKQRPVVRENTVVPAPTFSLVLNFDRRIMAGAQAAQFFARMVELLEKAEFE